MDASFHNYDENYEEQELAEKAAQERNRPPAEPISSPKLYDKPKQTSEIASSVPRLAQQAERNNDTTAQKVAYVREKFSKSNEAKYMTQDQIDAHINRVLGIDPVSKMTPKEQVQERQQTIQRNEQGVIQSNQSYGLSPSLETPFQAQGILGADDHSMPFSAHNGPGVHNNIMQQAQYGGIRMQNDQTNYFSHEQILNEQFKGKVPDYMKDFN